MISEHATLSKAVRISAGLTQKEIARRCGVCAASIARYERGMNLRDATYKQIDWIYPKLGAEARSRSTERSRQRVSECFRRDPGGAQAFK